VVDILSENRPRDLQLTRAIHQRKTARLFEACCGVGALAADADERTFNKLRSYGLDLGLAFQIADDLLDEQEDRDTRHRPGGSDAAAHKQTYPGAVGPAESRTLGEHAARQAVESLESFGPAADQLRQIAHYVMERTA